MREIDSSIITEAVKEMCISSNKILPNSLKEKIECAFSNEQENLPKSIMGDLIENLECACEMNIPICQDTGMAIVFAEIGQDVHIVGNFENAVNEGVSKGYTEGLLRCSIVSDPLERINTNDNTPAIIHTRLVDGDKIKLTVAPKGFGSENMSCLKMMTPAAKREDIIDYVVECVKNAGSNPCPPIVLGVGIGGDFEYCAYLAKKALIRDADVRNSNEYYRDMELEILKKVNNLNIGPQGFGGKTTALAVNIEVGATHIAGLPVSVNVGCHVTRHQAIII